VPQLLARAAYSNHTIIRAFSAGRDLGNRDANQYKPSGLTYPPNGTAYRFEKRLAGRLKDPAAEPCLA
jgi:hypothetical protein